MRLDPAVTLSLLWIPATLIASVAQTARNALQRSLTETLGTVGATQVRFLYGFPFALCSWPGWCWRRGGACPRRTGASCCSCWRRSGADRRHGADAGGDARAFLRRDDGADQDRAGAGGRVRLPGARRQADAGRRGRRGDRDCRRGADGGEAGRRAHDRGGVAAHRDGRRCGGVLRAERDRLSRRDPLAGRHPLRARRDDDARLVAGHTDGC